MRHSHKHRNQGKKYKLKSVTMLGLGYTSTWHLQLVLINIGSVWFNHWHIIFFLSINIVLVVCAMYETKKWLRIRSCTNRTAYMMAPSKSSSSSSSAIATKKKNKQKWKLAILFSKIFIFVVEGQSGQATRCVNIFLKWLNFLGFTIINEPCCKYNFTGI